jgi:oligopeptide/dipeptide ABC transporter ATP-binding protein
MTAPPPIDAALPSPAPLLAVRGLTKRFDLRRGLRRWLQPASGHVVQALDGVDLDIARGETLGVIGESGCGKSTLGRTILRLHEPSAGRVLFDGVDVTALDRRGLTAMRRRMQIIFQDPYASLNPRRRVGDIVGRGLEIHGGVDRRAAARRAADLLAQVGLSPDHADRYPHQFSGGQRQRIGIARALAVRPDFIVCDEPVSALDMSIQAQILALLAELKRALGLTYLFISHDLAVVAHVADRIAVMYLGRIVEIAPAARLVAAPAHPYTRALLAAVPRIDGAAAPARLAGEPPSPLAPPSGCAFHPRCPQALEICRRVAPGSVTLAPGHGVACHLHEGAAA